MFQFNSNGIYYLCYLGNDDLRIFDELLERTCSKYTHAVYLAQRKFEIGDLEFVGFNWVVDYPFRLKDRCRMDTNEYIFQEQFGAGLLSTLDGWKEIKDWFSYVRTLPTIEDEINRLVRPKNVAQSIYVIHMPPCKLGLDESGNGRKVGSKAIYDFLLKYQPKLSFHGHIHESPEVSERWYAKLGNTICVQPGQLDALTYVVVDLDTMEFERYTEAF